MKKFFFAAIIILSIFVIFSGCSKDESPAAPDAEKTAEAVLTEAAGTETAEAALRTDTPTATITRTPDETATVEAVLTMVGEAEATNTQEAADTATAEAALFTETATVTVTSTVTITATYTLTVTLTPVPKIVFVSNRTGNNEIYIIDADGTNQTQFTTHSADDQHPEWCYERNEIIFASNRNGQGYDICGKSISGSLVYTIIGGSSNQTYPSCGPDGKIAYADDSGSYCEIYVFNGGSSLRLTDNSVTDTMPDISPGGDKVVFMSERHGNAEIYVMDADGQNVIRLTNNSATDEHPSWSPDGSRIVFQSNRDGNKNIYVMNANGSAEARLTDFGGVDDWPCWSPDGSKILFTSARDGDYEIYIMNADGTVQGNLTEYPSVADIEPAWH